MLLERDYLGGGFFYGGEGLFRRIGEYIVGEGLFERLVGEDA